MFTRLTIRGLGPHESTALGLDPSGTTEIRGRSESGKTFALRALLWLLTGRDIDGGTLDPAAIRDGHDRCDVAVETARGTVIRRTLTRGGSQTRTITKSGEAPAKHGSDAVFAAALGPYASPRLRLVMAPLAWRALAAGHARELRDLLVGDVTADDLRAEVMRIMHEEGAALAPGDPVEESPATERRRTANILRDRAAGALSARTADVEAAEARPVESADAGDAPAVLAAAADWELYDRDHLRWRAAADYRAKEEHAAEHWDARRDAVPEAPDPAEVERAKRDLDERTAERETVKAAWVKACSAADRAATTRADADTSPDYETANAQALVAGLQRDVKALPADDTCQNCGRPWAAAAERRAALVTRLRSECMLAAEVADDEPERRAVRVAEAQSRLDAAVAERDRLADDLAGAHARTHAAAREYDALRERAAAHAAAARALGTRPKVPDPQPEPVAPAGDRPDGALVADARARAAAAERAAGVAAERERALVAARKALAAALVESQSTAAEAARLDVLVSAVRAAPGAIARERVAGLGNIGPCSLAWGAGTAADPAVRVLVDGRDWDLASTGRQIVADAAFRAGLRRLWAMPWAQLFIDRPQDVGGQPLPDVAPCVILRTTDGDLEVETAGA